LSEAKPFSISKAQIWEAWKCVKANSGAAGVDRESIESFQKDLSKNLYKIWNRMSSGSYMPPPVLAVDIPKKSGGTRTLGVPAVSDRVAQTVVKLAIEPKLEEIFLPDSYGYRPNRSAHDAIAVTRKRCWESDWVLEFDIKGLFDNIPWDLLIKAVRCHIDCKWILLYIERWLKAPMQTSDGVIVERIKGTPQGGCVSPILSNLFLHYCFDLWITRKFPSLKWCRYADDGLLHCKSRKQAEFVLKELSKRMKECGLQLNLDKTRIVYCRDSRRRQKEDLNSFDFLGFRFQTRTARNKADGHLFDTFSPSVSATAMKTMRQTVKHGWKLNSLQHLSIQEVAKQVNPVIQGWISYYGRFNIWALKPLVNHINKRLLIWVKNKHRKLRDRETAAWNWLKCVYDADPNLFAHWKRIPVY
jgi:RNA-directed DNA polymerase